MSPRWKKRLRRLALFAAGGAAGLLLLSVLGLAWLRSDSGRAWLARTVEGEAAPLFAGRFRLERIEGNLTSSMEVRGLTIQDREGRSAVSLRRARAEYSLAALIDRLHVERLEVEGLDVKAHTTSTGLNLGELLVPSKPDPEPSEPLTLSVGRISIRDVAFSLDGEALARDLDAELAFAMDRGRIEARRVDVSVDGARLTADRLDFDPASTALRAAADLSVPSSLASRLAGDPDLTASLDLSLSAVHPSALAPWTAFASGRLAGSPLTLSATVAPDFNDARLDLALASVDPNAVHRAAPRGRLHLETRARRDGERLRLDLSGRGGLSVAPSLPRLDFSRIAATATLAGDRLDATLLTRGRGKSTGQRVEATARLRLGPKPVLETSRVQISLSHVRPLLPPSADLDAEVAVDARASGPLDDLSVSGRAGVRSLHLPGVRVEDVDARVDVSHLPKTPVGRIDARVRNADLGALFLATADLEITAGTDGAGSLALEARGRPLSSVDLEGTFEIGPGRRKLSLSRGRAVLNGGRISVRRLEVEQSEKVIGWDAALQTPLGGVETVGALDPRMPFAGEGQVRLAASDLQLAGLAELLPSLEGIEGRGDVHLSGALGPKRDLSARILFRQVGYRGSAPVSVDLTADLERTLTSSLAVSSAVGRVSAEMVSRVPADPLHWVPGQIDRIDVDLKDVALAGVAEQVALQGGPTLPLTGRATSALRLRGDHLEHEVKVVGFELAEGVDAELGLKTRSTRGVLDASLLCRAATVAVVRAEVAASVPEEPLDVRAWTRVDAGAVRSLKAEVEPIELAEVADILHLPPLLEGRVSAKLDVAERLTRASVDARLVDARTAEISYDLDADLSARFEGRSGRARLDLRARGAPVLVAQGGVGLGLSDLLAGRVPARARLDGGARLVGFPLAMVGEALKRPESFAGLLTGSATVTGTLGRPRVAVDLSADRPRVGPMDFSRFAVAGAYDGSAVRAEADLSQITGGFVDLRLSSAADRLDLQAEAERFRLGFLSYFLPEEAQVALAGQLDADLRLTGKGDRFQSAGRLSLSNGRVVPPHPLQVLDDVRIDVTARGRTVAMEMKARSGEGALKAGARAIWDGASAVRFEGDASTSELPLSVGKTPITLDLGAGLSGRSDEEGTELAVKLTEGLVKIPERSARELHEVTVLEDVEYVDERGRRAAREKQRSPPASEEKGPVIHVFTERPLPVRSKDVNATARLDLRIASGRVYGHVSVSDGFLMIGGRPWTIDHARIDMDGSEPPRPVVDVELVHEFDRVVVRILVSGTPDDPKLRFESTPATYDQAELLAVVLGGEPGGSGEGTLEGKATGAAAGLLVSAMRSQFGEDLWLDTINVDLDDQTSAAKIQLGKWITRQIFLGYEHDFGAREGENTAEAVLRYRFLPGWMVEGRFGDRGNGGVDLLWTKRF